MRIADNTQPVFGEYDPEKSRRNKEKHGISFEEAKAAWTDGYLSIQGATTKNEEERFRAIGMIREKLWVVFFTHRPDGLRIFSARRARDNERMIYEQTH